MSNTSLLQLLRKFSCNSIWYLFDECMPDKLRAAIRDVPNFPKEGIIFKDITPVLGDPALLQSSIDQMAATAEDLKIDKVVGIDARGFIFAPP